MRSLVRRGLIVGSCFGAMVASSGCEAKKATEYVSGISTQMQVPRDIKSIRVQVTVGGAVQFCEGYKVYNGTANLPRSLGNFPQNIDSIKGMPIRYEIAGLSEDFAADSVNPIFSTCDAATVKADSVHLLRSSTQPYIPERILFLPLPLKYSCYDVDCSKQGEGMTCKGGQCVSDNMTAADAAHLPDFVPGMGEGNDGACFSVGLCMGAAIPAIPVDTSTCDFVIPETKDAPTVPAGDVDPFRAKCTTATDCSAGRQCTNGLCDLLPPGSPPWTGINVEVSYDGARTKEILDLDPVEGYSIPDPAKPQTFRLSPGLCAMWKGASPDHRITGVRASATCGPKTATQDICYADQLALQGLNNNGVGAATGACTVAPLKPTKAALVVVVDDTVGHQSFFAADKIATFKIPLADPAFDQTQFALMYAPTSASDLCDVNAPVVVPLEPAAQGGTDITNALVSVANDHSKLVNATTSFAAGMMAGYNYLNGNASGLLRRAVLVVGNDVNVKFDTDTSCSVGQPETLADAALNSSTPIDTYVLQIVDTPSGNANKLAFHGYAGAKDPLIYNPAPTTDADKATAFQTIVNRLGTCAYDVDPANKPDTTASLTYADPLLNTRQSIPFNAHCTTDNDSGNDGWGFDASGTHIFVCGKPCSDYQAVLTNASNFTLLYGQPALAVPLYQYSKTCDPLSP